MRQNNITTGAKYLITGSQLIFDSRFRLFVVVPILVNIVVFLILTSLALSYFSSAVGAIVGLLPDWQWLAPVLNILATIIWIAAAIVAVIFYGYSFSIITNILAAPFYGILAEKIEFYLTGQSPPPEAIASMVARVIGRELVKLWYFVSRGLALMVAGLILSFVPLANLFVPVIFALWAAWSMAIQFADYPADNHQIPFRDFRANLGQSRYSAWGFGGLTALGTTIPLINILVMPAAVAGGTVFWVEELRARANVKRTG